MILGAGIAGLGAALALAETGSDFTMLELEDGPGGLVRTDEVDGFRFDRTGHFLHFKGDLLWQQLQETGVPFDRIERKSAVLVGEAVVPYPIQYNLWALDSPELAQASLAELTGDGHPDGPPETFADLMLRSWGKTLYDIFFQPYNEKLWGRPDRPARGLRRRVPPHDRRRPRGRRRGRPHGVRRLQRHVLLSFERPPRRCRGCSRGAVCGPNTL